MLELAEHRSLRIGITHSTHLLRKGVDSSLQTVPIFLADDNENWTDALRNLNRRFWM